MKNIVVAGIYHDEYLPEMIPDLIRKMGCENDVHVLGYERFGKVVPYKDKDGQSVRIRCESVKDKWLVLANAGNLETALALREDSCNARASESRNRERQRTEKGADQTAQDVGELQP